MEKKNKNIKKVVIIFVIIFCLIIGSASLILLIKNKKIDINEIKNSLTEKVDESKNNNSNEIVKNNNNDKNIITYDNESLSSTKLFNLIDNINKDKHIVRHYERYNEDNDKEEMFRVDIMNITEEGYIADITLETKGNYILLNIEHSIAENQIKYSYLNEEIIEVPIDKSLNLNDLDKKHIILSEDTFVSEKGEDIEYSLIGEYLAVLDYYSNSEIITNNLKDEIILNSFKSSYNDTSNDKSEMTHYDVELNSLDEENRIRSVVENIGDNYSYYLTNEYQLYKDKIINIDLRSSYLYEDNQFDSEIHIQYLEK